MVKVKSGNEAVEYIKSIAPLFQKYPSPISVAVRLAQHGQETGWGESELFKKANNGFGIKASEPWDGDVVLHNSPEVIKGKANMYRSGFRSYDSFEDSIKDHAAFFTSTKFRASDKAYGLAIKADNYKDEAKNLGPKFKGDKASYATDPNYASQLINMVERYNLTQYDIAEDSAKDVKQDKKEESILTKLRTPIKQHTLINMGGQIGKVKYIVIHFVGAPGQAKANADYFYNVYREASAHLFIDKNVTYEVVPENRVAWHVG